MANLFESSADEQRRHLAPLADRMRPRSFGEVVGQEHLTADDAPLARQLAAGQVPNMVLVGPPGTGKTSMARLVAQRADMELHELSAVACGLPDVRRVISEANELLGTSGRQTVLFLDEIHRFNKAQQDALLPAVESGTIRLIGATTENPYVSINRALLSRLVAYELRALTAENVDELLTRALSDSERGLARAMDFTLDDDARGEILRLAGGDARTALTLLEIASVVGGGPGAESGGTQRISLEAVQQASDKRRILYDRAGDAHYDTISAYIKSMRAGNADDALLYLAAMVEGGEDPVFIARRLAIFASEDVGNADPQALLLANAALQVTASVGLPEARITLSQVTRYCAEAPKDKTAYQEIERAAARVRESGSPDVPEHLLNRKRP